MASISQRNPRSPRRAARRRSKLDTLLDPEFFKALADPTRAKLLACLIKCDRPCSVTEVAQCCTIDFSVVARHLATLARAGALESNKEGRTVWYSARSVDISDRLRALADAIEQWGADADQRPRGRGACCAKS